MRGLPRRESTLSGGKQGDYASTENGNLRTENRYPLIEAGMSRHDCMDWWDDRYDMSQECSAHDLIGGGPILLRHDGTFSLRS